MIQDLKIQMFLNRLDIPTFNELDEDSQLTALDSVIRGESEKHREDVINTLSDYREISYIYNAARNGNADVISTFHNPNINYAKVAKLAAENGHMNVLDLVWNRVKDAQLVANAAAKGNRLEIVRKLKSFDLDHNPILLNLAEAGHFDSCQRFPIVNVSEKTLRWVLNFMLVDGKFEDLRRFTARIGRDLLREGNDGIYCRVVAKRGYNHNYYNGCYTSISLPIAIEVAASGYEDTLHIFWLNGISADNFIHQAIVSGIHKRFLPYVDDWRMVATGAAEAGDLELLREAIRKDNYNRDEIEKVFDIAAREGNANIVAWMLQNFIIMENNSDYFPYILEIINSVDGGRQKAENIVW